MFCDTSTLAKYYANEEESAAVRHRMDAEEVTLSELARVELMSVFHRRFRERIWNRAQFLRIVSQFEQDDIKGAWTWLPIDRDIIKFSAGVYVRLSEHLFLRASDCTSPRQFIVTKVRFTPMTIIKPKRLKFSD
jgi:PIN domain